MDDRHIFLEALNRTTPEERAAYLDEACGEDADLRRRVELLLAAHEDAGSFLEKTPEELLATLDQRDEVDLDSWKELLTPSDKEDCLGLLGRYEILELIGRGGMGIVLSARDPQLNRVVAIKMLAPELSTQPVSVRRFLREAQAAAAVSHDHVITIHAVEEQAKPPLIVMERIAGQSLQEKIDREGPLDVKSILRIGMQTASGLAAAHKQGLIHRDIKPSNILLENGIERVKLTDFGLARAVDDIGMTRTGQITGTPQYMSPEQAQGHTIDHRTDLFSLGCVLYAMCTGQAAFRADSAVAVMHRVVHESPKPIREINEDIPDWLCRIVEKLMEKDPDQRFASASEVEDLLGRHLAHLQQPESVPQPEPIQPSESTSRNALQRSRKTTASFLEYCMSPQSKDAKRIFIPMFILCGIWMFIVMAVTIGNASQSIQTLTLGAGGIVLLLAFVIITVSAWFRARNESAIDSADLIDAELARASRTFLGAGLASLACFVWTFLALNNHSLRFVEEAFAAFIIVGGLMSLPVGLLAMNAYWDIPRRKRYWWVVLAARAAVIPWNPFLLLALPWTLRALRTLKHSAVRQEFADVANSTNRSAGSAHPASTAATGTTARSLASTRGKLLAGFFLLTCVLSIFGGLALFDHYTSSRKDRFTPEGRLVVNAAYEEDVTVKIKGPEYAVTSYSSFDRRVPPGEYLIIAWRTLEEGNAASYAGTHTVRQHQTTTVDLEQKLARPGIADFDAIEPFLADGPEIATLHITVDDPDVQLTINGAEWDIAGKGPQSVSLKPGRYEFIGLKGSAKEFNQAITLKTGDERILSFRTLSVAAEVPDATEWKLLLSAAASIPLDEWNTLAGDIKGPSPAAIRGEPLSLVLFKLNPFEAARENEKVRQDFWYLTETIPKPDEIGEAIGISREKGFVSFLQPEYIKALHVDQSEDTAQGHAGFTVPRLYSGRVEFEARREDGQWAITKFTLPNYGITLRADEQGRWQRVPISTLPPGSPTDVTVTIGKDGSISIQSSRVDWSDLDQTLLDIKTPREENRIMLEVHSDVPYTTVVEVIDRLKEHGYRKLLIQPIETEGSNDKSEAVEVPGEE